YLRLMRRERRVELTSTLTEEDLVAVEAASMEAGLEHLDRELNEK
ncbi:type II toxin-antitoxin system Phd/YefM family antitoxin, partial [Falsochrobactrum shanghaiense]